MPLYPVMGVIKIMPEYKLIITNATSFTDSINYCQIIYTISMWTIDCCYHNI